MGLISRWCVSYKLHAKYQLSSSIFYSTHLEKLYYRCIKVFEPEMLQNTEVTKNVLSLSQRKNNSAAFPLCQI